MEKTSMRRARKKFAARVSVPAVYETDESGKRVLKQRRIRVRHPLGTSFKAWSRKAFAAAQSGNLSPKLAKIVRG